MRTLQAGALACIAMAALSWTWLASAGEGGRRTEELMRLSGMAERLAKVQPEVLRDLDDSPGMRPDVRELLVRVVGEALRPAKLQDGAMRELRRVLSPADESAALGYFSTDLGRKVARLERLAEADGGARRHASLARSQWSTASPQRRDLLGRLANAVSYAEAQADTYILMTTTMQYAAGLASRPTDAEKTVQAYELTVVKNRLARLRPELVRVARESARTELAYMYRDLGDDDLDRVVAFAESPAGLRYSDANMKALSQVFVAVHHEVGTGIGEELVRREGR